jgi:hypothetical protein
MSILRREDWRAVGEKLMNIWGKIPTFSWPSCWHPQIAPCSWTHRRPIQSEILYITDVGGRAIDQISSIGSALPKQARRRPNIFNLRRHLISRSMVPKFRADATAKKGLSRAYDS